MNIKQRPSVGRRRFRSSCVADQAESLVQELRAVLRRLALIVELSKETAMTTRIFALAAGLTFLAMPLVTQAQGIVRGAQQGVAVGGSAGNRAAGPVGTAVGATVGGVAGGVAGGVNGALGIQPASYHHHRYHHHYRH
jgi:hypothetical protein